MNKYITSFTTTEEFNTSKSGLRRPHVSLTKDDMKVHYMSYDYSDRYLTFIALESGIINFTLYSWADTSYVESIAYSKNNGEWVETQNSDNREEDIVISISVVEGDKVRWKGIANHIGSDGDNGGVFTSTCRFNAQGNIMSLLYGDVFNDKTTIENDYAFVYLFSDINNYDSCLVTSALDLVLPATTLADQCYWGMFDSCTSLTTAPELPATTLASSCYSNMFYGCTALTTAPELPATTLANYCYYYMFYGCTSLTTAPLLPATTLEYNCYSYMFRDCTSLTTAPELPATTLVSNCYSSMFQGCTSLTTAPELPATTLAQSCYYHMFYRCIRLNYIKCLATDISATNCTLSWVSNVSSSGTFVKDASMTSWTTGVNGIPSGWNIVNDYSQDYLTTEALEDGTISFNIWRNMNTDMINSISYSTDNGLTWNTTNNIDNKSENLIISVNVNEGDKVLWKGNAQQMSYNDVEEGDYVGSFFSSDCEFDVEGNVMSLLYGDNFKGEDTLEYAGQFACLFHDYDGENVCNVVNASNLILPATILAEGCYSNMFYGCTALTTAPELPATTLANYCYYYMFYGCTSLTTAPVLSATALANFCYNYMFSNCTSLNYIKAMFTTTPSSTYTWDWVSGVASTGTFVKNSAATWDVTGDDGIPTGWTVQTASS